MFFELPYDYASNTNEQDFVTATYYVFGVSEKEILKKAGTFAIGQSIGTWIPLPGVTEDMITEWQARVLAVYALPGEENVAVLRVAFPMHNFASSFTMMLTSMVGNDVSTALRIKLIDLEFSNKALTAFSGPKQGIEGFRKVTGVYDRPLILNMIKPCMGYSPEHGADLFYQSGRGGVDLIKDDELFGNTTISGVLERLKAYQTKAEQLKKEIGKAPVYIPNITDTPKKMRAHAKALIEEGAKAAMVNFVFAGLDALKELTEEFGNQLCFLAHYAGFGIMDSRELGIAEPVMLGILPRLAGADAVMTMYAGEEHAEHMLACLQTVQKQKLPLNGIKPIMSTLGGGVTPMSLAQVVKTYGNDMIIGVGGAIQGHPTGTSAGAKATMDALMGAVNGEGIEKTASKSKELAAAIEAWGAR